MAYSDFTLASALEKLSLSLRQEESLFAEVAGVKPSALLAEVLKDNIPTALAIHTEKARSELIVMPVLMEIRRRAGVGLFSGIEFNVDDAQGLRGVCDFLLSQTQNSFFIEAPVLSVVEAKNDNIKSGLGQCVAEMVAARLFNERAGKGPRVIYGLVTTGSIWRFLRLDEGAVVLDSVEYYLDQLPKILGILLSILQLESAPLR
jgi:hypothetical protein